MDRRDIRSQGRCAAKALDKENASARGAPDVPVMIARVPDAARGIGSRRCARRAATRRARSQSLEVVYSTDEESFLIWPIC